jgi:hypothetical protein
MWPCCGCLAYLQSRISTQWLPRPDEKRSFWELGKRKIIIIIDTTTHWPHLKSVLVWHPLHISHGLTWDGAQTSVGDRPVTICLGHGIAQKKEKNESQIYHIHQWLFLIMCHIVCWSTNFKANMQWRQMWFNSFRDGVACDATMVYLLYKLSELKMPKEKTYMVTWLHCPCNCDLSPTELTWSEVNVLLDPIMWVQNCF